MSSSWKLESSQAIQAPGSTRPGSSDSARPTLPATSTGTLPARSIAPTSSVVVVLPLVPVIPMIGLGSMRAASSTSLHTGTPARRAAATGGACPGTPGLLITAVTPASSNSSPQARYSAPAAESLPGSTSGAESVASTCEPGHMRAIASQAARPERRSPTTT